MIKTILILLGTVALGFGQVESDPGVKWQWQLEWLVKGKIVGNVEVGVGSGACEICPPPFVTATPPPTANCNIPYVPWNYTLGPIQTRSYSECESIASFTYALWTRPCCGSGEWTRRETLHLGKIAPPGFCLGKPPQSGQGTWKPANILACE